MLGLVLASTVGTAYADHAGHGGMAMSEDAHDSGNFYAGVSVVAAQFASTFYEGEYQGASATVGWTSERYSVAAMLPAYHLEENGLATDGLGDAMVHGTAALTRNFGVVLGVSLPTADGYTGLGMGHTMVMTAATAAWHEGHLGLYASGGFSRAMTSLENHDHGMWPLVEPMNMSEITWGAAASLDLGRHLQAGAHVTGGVPVEAPGVTRAIAGVRLAWARGRVVTAATLDSGVMGDPFTLRGVVETSLRF